MSRPRPGAVLALLFLAPLSFGAEPFRYPEGKHGKGELKYVNGLPVLQIEGDATERGEQLAMLTAKTAERLLDFPKDYLKSMRLDFAYPMIVKMAKTLEPHFPPDHLKELESGAKAGKLDRDLLVAANSMFDIRKLMGCSTLIVEPSRSASNQMIFGRNLDFPTMGYLHKYSLVTVVRPTGKHAFASIGFPGVIGALSGMNDAGLALAVLESYAANDNSLKFDAEGTPYALCFRRLLEECATVDEAEKLLRTMKRTTRISLAICDKTDSAVFEITPKTIAVRRAENGVVPCTNHFRTKELATDTKCVRYSILEKCIDKDAGKFDLASIAKKLDEVSQGPLTIHTMVFEPATLTLHLSLGEPPTSKRTLNKIELGPLFDRKTDDK